MAGTEGVSTKPPKESCQDTGARQPKYEVLCRPCAKAEARCLFRPLPSNDFSNWWYETRITLPRYCHSTPHYYPASSRFCSRTRRVVEMRGSAPTRGSSQGAQPFNSQVRYEMSKAGQVTQSPFVICTYFANRRGTTTNLLHDAFLYKQSVSIIFLPRPSDPII